MKKPAFLIIYYEYEAAVFVKKYVTIKLIEMFVDSVYIYPDNYEIKLNLFENYKH